MSQTINMEIHGLDELNQALSNLVEKYPDEAQKLLEKSAKEFRKDLVKEVKKVTVGHGRKTEKPLGKTSSYKISNVQGFGSNQFIELRANAPHFHLVEHGHELVKNGRNIGFVQGKHMMETTREKYKEHMPKRVERMMEKILRREGLL